MDRSKRCLTTIWIVLLTSATLPAQPAKDVSFAGQDVHLSGKTMQICKSDDADPQHILVFPDGFSMSVGDNAIRSESAVVLITKRVSELRGIASRDYDVRVYLENNVNVSQGKSARTSGLDNTVINRGQALVARFLVTGEIFAAAETQTALSMEEIVKLDLSRRALLAAAPIRSEPHIREEAMVPPYHPQTTVAKKTGETKAWSPFNLFAPMTKKTEAVEPGVDESALGETSTVESLPSPETPAEYPVSIAGLWDPAPQIQNTRMGDGRQVATVIGRFYLWQKRDDRSGLIEFQADNAVVFHNEAAFGEDSKNRTDGVLASGKVRAIYFRGNIVMTEGVRTIRADEMYYDFEQHQGIAINAELRTFDPKRQLPVYLRAQQLRQIAETSFEAEQIVLTTSEFYLPQISLTASRMILTDTSHIDARAQAEADNKTSFEGTLYDIEMKLGSASIFRWPKLATNFARPDVPIRRLRVGNDSDFGTTIESRWYLSRLLGWSEPAGVDSNLSVDYYSERGIGAGMDVEYQRETYYGELLGYVMTDRGTDDLGRTADRKNIDSDEDVRGRFLFRHRQYLPYDWQVTIETSYLSDENFLEWMYRDEYELDKSQETLIHLKRIRDNWAFSFLSKFRINDFETTTDELPTAEFHWSGQSFWDDQLTFYSDTQVSRMKFRRGRERFPDWSHSVANRDRSQPQEFYTFFTTRNEVDWPMNIYTAKIVPYVAGTYGFEDQLGFRTELDGTTVPDRDREDSVSVGEAGVRASTMFWKADPFAKSRFWDINGLRHIITPHVEAATFDATDKTADLRDIVNVGLSQRWQTRRGPQEKLRTLDWIRFDVDATFVSENAEPAAGPWDPAWNHPAIPMAVRRSQGEYGALRDSISNDFEWRVSDTTTILGDTTYDIRSGYVQQFNIGVSRYIFPDISYYIGNRYLRPVVIDAGRPFDVHEEGSNALVAALTYNLNERYTAILAQEYNFDYEESIRTEVTLLRRYHRMFYGLSYTMDGTRDRQSVMLSIWPQGVKELALGNRRYYGATSPVREE